MTLYQALQEAGITTYNHDSDLYFPVNAETTAILQKFPVHFKQATRFIDNITGKLFYDAPFCYDPFWANHVKLRSTEKVV
jgi:hypothetical protein